MRRIYAFVLFISLLNFQGFAQINRQQCENCFSLKEPKVKRDSLPPIDRYDLNFYYHGSNQKGHDFDHDLLYTLQRNWVAHQEIGYLSISAVAPIRPYLVRPRQDEGIGGSFSVFEAKVPVRFTIMQGRPSSKPHWRRMRLTLDYSPNFRMLYDESKPLTPSDQPVGIGYDYVFWDNNKYSIKENADSNYQRPVAPLNTKRPLRSWSFSTQIHHYSNGQSGKFKYVNPFGVERNNYANGDFSTNYIRLGLTHSVNFMETGALLQGSVIYRQDWSIGNTLVITPDQNKSYGRSRLELRFDYRPKVFYTKTRVSHQQGGKTYLVRKAFQSLWRLETTLIMGNLDKFKPNLSNWDGENKYRTGVRAYYQLNPLNHRNMGYMIMAYYGRDYLNIRYDNIVYSLQAGFTFSLDKFFPTTYHTNRSIEGLMEENYQGPYTGGKTRLPMEYLKVE